jgi:hypothetical protein
MVVELANRIRQTVPVGAELGPLFFTVRLTVAELPATPLVGDTLKLETTRSGKAFAVPIKHAIVNPINARKAKRMHSEAIRLGKPAICQSI